MTTRFSSTCLLSTGALLGILAGLVGCAECTQVILGKGDLSNVREPYGEWRTASAVKLNAENPSLFDLSPGKGILVNGAPGGTVDILTTAEYGDVRVSYDFCVPQGSSPGILFMGRYELELTDTAGAEALKPGEWQSVDVLFRAPRFNKSGLKTENAKFKRVELNNTLIHRDLEISAPAQEARFNDEQPFGPLLAQGNHGQIAFRNVRITPLHLP